VKSYLSLSIHSNLVFISLTFINQVVMFRVDFYRITYSPPLGVLKCHLSLESANQDPGVGVTGPGPVRPHREGF
jgi:hypothetical protein